MYTLIYSRGKKGSPEIKRRSCPPVSDTYHAWLFFLVEQVTVKHAHLVSRALHRHQPALLYVVNEAIGKIPSFKLFDLFTFLFVDLSALVMSAVSGAFFYSIRKTKLLKNLAAVCLINNYLIYYSKS